MTAVALTDAWASARDVPIVDDSDQQLVTRAKTGDADAFSELVRRHQTTVYNLAYRFMRETHSAEDMAQEAFVKAFRLLRGFRGDCSFSTWMYRVASSVCLTELSRRKKRGEVALTDGTREAATVESEPETADVSEIIRSCVGKLSERHATIITLYYLQGVSYDKIAETMRVPLGTLKTWMHRARKKLKKIVERELQEDVSTLFG